MASPDRPRRSRRPSPRPRGRSAPRPRPVAPFDYIAERVSSHPILSYRAHGRYFSPRGKSVTRQARPLGERPDQRPSSATLNKLGRAVGASERTLSRLFRTELGMSFSQWRTLLRVQHALVHLVHGHSVTDIALRCGWSNPTSFIEAFAAIIGRTPGRYQSDLRRAQRHADVR
ncbi:helix-turn-helix transcriptional regulator [Nocardia sp. NPDC051570]|uniref:helix-turn-helix transcriptional regulator n=1 Tax=Nocardia sp. NPDC051570 TaxID=3364324 RepID=UPI0037A8BC05